MPARISRQYLSDDSLGRAIKMISAQVSNIGTLTHRYRDEPEVTYYLAKDDNALCDVLGILLGEQRARRIEDSENAEEA